MNKPEKYTEVTDILEDVLKKDGLSLEKLKNLSYHSNLGIRLKKNLHYFDKDLLFKELDEVNAWYDCCDGLHNIVTDYRIKSIQSARLKYERYYPDHQMGKVFNVTTVTKLAVSCGKNTRVVKSEQKKIFWRCKTMCYLIAKKFNDVGCIALQTTHGRHLADFKRTLIAEIGTEEVQLVTISRPSAYGEYEPYRFVDTEREFEQEVKKLSLPELNQ